MRRHALVTGGAGFLGSHLCGRLLADGATVHCLDNLLTGSHDNVGHMLHRAAFEFVQWDITKPYVPSAPPDVIFHLASPASPRAYLANPIHTLKVGSLGTLNALGIAKATGARFVLASTSEVYGDPEVNPQPETYPGNVSTTGPRAVYDESKRLSESLTLAYRREHGVSTNIARIFNTYGPRLGRSDGRVISSFITQALAGEPLTINGDGSQTRSFCYVDDLVDGLVRLAQRDEEMPVNLGNPDERTILEVARIVLSITASSSPIEHGPAMQDDPRVRRPDITRAKSLLGWEPQTSLEEGLRSTVEWYRRRSHAASHEGLEAPALAEPLDR